MPSKEIAAFAYRVKKGRIEFVSVTNRKGTRLILPKGQPDARLADSKVALLEAYEEAGVVAALDQRLQPLVVKLSTSRGPVRLKIYPMRIQKLLRRWPESDFRTRLLLETGAASGRLDKKLQKCVAMFSWECLQLEHSG